MGHSCQEDKLLANILCDEKVSCLIPLLFVPVAVYANIIPSKSVNIMSRRPLLNEIAKLLKELYD